LALKPVAIDQDDLNTVQPARPASSRTALSRLRELGLPAAIVALLIVAVVVSPSFLNHGNIINILRQIALYGIVSVGMTCVILTKGIDLSVGSIVGIVSVCSALMLSSGVPIPLAIAISLLIGCAVGLVNGLGVAFGGMPPFIMTLGMMVVGRGVAMTLAEGQPLNLGARADAFSFLGSGFVYGLPVPFLLFATITAAGFYVLRFTSFGRDVYAVGSNTEAARLAGINVQRTLILVYVIVGGLAALTSLIYVSRLTVGQPIEGSGLELEAIAIVVIGGTSLFGGEGGVIGTVAGATILALLANILNLVGISPFSQQIVKGVIILCAVLIDTRRRTPR
jgi:ribose transport system permease protein